VLRLGDHAGRPPDPVLRLQLRRLSRAGEEGTVAQRELTAPAAEAKRACAAAYSRPAARWLLGGELHPGGAAATLRALELIDAGPGDGLLDVASGAGTSAILAARQLGCRATGVEYSAAAVAEARDAARAASLGDRAAFVEGDAESLPFADQAFDAVLCECSLCTFGDKERAVAEIHRVLRPGGRLAIADVVAVRSRLPAALRGALAQVACVGDALSEGELLALVEGAGFESLAVEDRAADAGALAERVEDRLRGARLLGWGQAGAAPVSVEEAIELVRLARRALASGALGYAIVTARR
jgi:SAM-dependent methyltransferase